MQQILAVGMLDVETFGMDAFFVQVSATEVMHYQVHRNGHIEANPLVPLLLADVYASIEKFNHGFIVDEPVPIKEISKLPAYLGRFEIISETRCRYRGFS
jgi:hypothetical protein